MQKLSKGSLLRKEVHVPFASRLCCSGAGFSSSHSACAGGRLICKQLGIWSNAPIFLVWSVLRKAKYTEMKRISTASTIDQSIMFVRDFSS